MLAEPGDGAKWSCAAQVTTRRFETPFDVSSELNEPLETWGVVRLRC